jgi:ATP-dependent protease Clp ATPase subunit
MKIKNIRKINNENLYDINTENKVFLCKEIIDDIQNNINNNTKKDNTTKNDNIKNDILLNNINNENICIKYNDKEKIGIIYDRRKLSTYSKKIG